MPDPGILTQLVGNPFLNGADPYSATPVDPNRDKLGFSSDQTLQAYNPSWGDRLKWGLSDALTAAGMKPATAQDYGERGLLAAQFTPVVGQALAGNEAYRDYQGGNYAGAALNAVGALPDVGTLTHGLGSLAIFAGPMAKTADKAALETATKMAAEGADKRSIWDATGWFTGADGKWRYEIPDNKANVYNPQQGYEGRLSGVVEHPDYFNAYPDTATMHSTFGQITGSNGAYGNVPGIGESIAIGTDTPTRTALHEMQHAVQGREGFARGGNPNDPDLAQASREIAAKGENDYLNLTDNLRSYQEKRLAEMGLSDRGADFDTIKGINAEWAQQNPELAARRDQAAKEMEARGSRFAYGRLAGEVEARNVQTRMNMMPEQRQATPPWETQDVPTDQQIVRGGGNGPQMSVDPDQPQGIIAYHGSPHSFDRFSLDKIGTGEGAQAFGHGLYFSDNENVAKSYKTDLAQTVAVDGKPILSNNRRIGTTGNRDLDDLMVIHSGDMDKVISDIKDDIASRPPNLADRRGLASMLEQAQALKDSGAVTSQNTGSMYQVSINANPDHFLDWDAPLESQHTQAIAALRDLEPNIDRIAGTGAADNPGYDRQTALQNVMKNLSESQIGRIIQNKHGIPGIKYLDAGSRSAGDGSRNYVVFSDKNIDIIKKYGLAAALGLGGAGAMTTMPDDANAAPASPEGSQLRSWSDQAYKAAKLSDRQKALLDARANGAGAN